MLKMLFYFLVLIGVLALAYYTTKLIGKSTGVRQTQGNMKVLDRMPLTRDSCLLVVEVENKIMLLGVSQTGITKLEDLEAYTKDSPAETMDFKAAFLKQLKENTGRFSGHRKNGEEK